MEVNEVGEVVMPWSASEELATSESRCCPKSLTQKLNPVILGFCLVEYCGFMMFS
jgi:hypothetical protein